MSHHVGREHRIWVFCKSSKHLSHLNPYDGPSFKYWIILGGWGEIPSTNKSSVLWFRMLMLHRRVFIVSQSGVLLKSAKKMTLAIYTVTASLNWEDRSGHGCSIFLALLLYWLILCGGMEFSVGLMKKCWPYRIWDSKDTTKLSFEAWVLSTWVLSSVWCQLRYHPACIRFAFICISFFLFNLSFEMVSFSLDWLWVCCLLDAGWPSALGLSCFTNAGIIGVHCHT